jgi:hypothetical protein
MSALPLKADILPRREDVGLGPEADLDGCHAEGQLPTLSTILLGTRDLLRPEAERPTKGCSKSGVQPLGVIESTSSIARIALSTASPSRVMAALSWRAALANF